MISLMDRLLKLENLDLCLTPYKVLATGQEEGMLEFIPSCTLAQVRSLNSCVSIQQLLNLPVAGCLKLLCFYSDI